MFGIPEFDLDLTIQMVYREKGAESAMRQGCHIGVIGLFGQNPDGKMDFHTKSLFGVATIEIYFLRKTRKKTFWLRKSHSEIFVQ